MRVEKRDLAGTVVAITGASAGIGRATALVLADAGANVVLGARRAERLQGLVEEIGAERAVAVPLDVRDPQQCRDLVGAAVQRWGRLDSLVANAGTGMYGGITDGSDEFMAEIMDVNLGGTVWSVRAAVPVMREAGGGDLVLMASVAGLRGGGNEAVYAATKHAQVGLAGSMDRELRPEGIRVTAICPAAVETEYALGRGRTEDDPARAQYLRPEDVAFQVLTVLEQPRRLRTTLWTLWSMSESS